MSTEDEESIRVYKCKLKTIFKSDIWPHVQPSIQDAVIRVSKLAPEISRFLQLHIQLSYFLQRPIPKIDKKLLENIYMSITISNEQEQPKCWSTDLIDTYKWYMVFRASQPFVSRKGLNQILKYFVHGYLTNIKVYHDNLIHNYLKKVANSLVSQLYRNDRLSAGSISRLKLHQYWQLKDNYEIDLESTDSLTTLQKLQDMVVHLEDLFENMIRLPKIAIVPHFNFSRKFIRLDQKALQELVFVGDSPMAEKGRELCKTNKAWSYLLEPKIIHRKFNDSIVTDGYQVSVNCYKGEEKVKKVRLPKAETEEEKQRRTEASKEKNQIKGKENRDKKKREFAAQEDLFQVTNDFLNFIFIDAGKETFLQMFNLTLQEIQEYLSFNEEDKKSWIIDHQLCPKAYSNFSSIEGVSYHFECGFTLKQQRAIEWSTNSCIGIILQHMLPSLKTNSLFMTLANIQVTTEWIEEIMMEKLKIRYAKLRFYVDVKKQKWWDKLVEEFKNKIVCLGNATNFGKAKGHRPTPIKFLIRFLRKKNINLLLINEYCTSKNCSACEQELEQTNVFRTKRCLSCKYQWNRDKNACINMFKNALKIMSF